MPASARTPWRTAARPPAPDDSSSVTVFTIRSPRQPHSEPRQHLGGEHHARDAALHVARAAAIEVAVAHLGPVGIARPAVARLRGDDVDMAVQEQAAPAARAGEPRRQLRAPVEPQAGRHLPRPGDVGGVGLPDVHGGARGAQAARPDTPVGRPPDGEGRPASGRWCRTRSAASSARPAHPCRRRPHPGCVPPLSPGPMIVKARTHRRTRLNPPGKSWYRSLHRGIRAPRLWSITRETSPWPPEARLSGRSSPFDGRGCPVS